MILSTNVQYCSYFPSSSRCYRERTGLKASAWREKGWRWRWWWWGTGTCVSLQHFSSLPTPIGLLLQPFNHQPPSVAACVDHQIKRGGPLQTQDPQLLLRATSLLLVIIGSGGRERLYVFCHVDFMAVSGQMKLAYQQLLRWVINVRTFACRARPSPALHHFQLHLFARKACALPSNWRLPTHFPPRPHINDTYIVTIAVIHFPISKWSAQAQDSRHFPVLRYVIPPMLGAVLRKGHRPWIWWNWPQIVSISDSPKYIFDRIFLRCIRLKEKVNFLKVFLLNLEKVTRPLSPCQKSTQVFSS